MTTLNLVIGQSSDDAHERHNGTPADLAALFVRTRDSTAAANLRDGGLRFTGVTIPQGSTINSCDLLVLTEGNSDLNAFLAFEDADDPPTFVAVVGGVTGRIVGVTTERQLQDELFAAFSEVVVGGLDPGMISSLQEVIDRSGWVSGQAISLILWTDNSPHVNRVFHWRSWDGKTDTDQSRLDIDHSFPEISGLPEYGQRRAAIGDPSVYGAPIVRS